MATAVERGHRGDLVAPAHRAGGQRVQQQPTQGAARDLGPATGAVVLLVTQHLAVLVEDARRLAARMDQRHELGVQVRRLQRDLAVVVVDVEHAALRPRVRRGLGFEDRGGDAVHVQDARQHQPAEPGADDRDGRVHGFPFAVPLRRRTDRGASWNVIPRCWNNIPDVSRYGMPRTSRSPQRREDSLSRDRIVDAAVALLDERGESGLTFRSLAERLATGPGAIYWHVADKRDLLTAACDAVVARTLDAPAPGATPHAAVRALALGLFDAIDAHPWVGAALVRAPGQLPMVRILEGLGRQLHALGVPGDAQWAAVSTLLHYILGVSAQNAANAHMAQVHGLGPHDLPDRRRHHVVAAARR